MADPSPTTSDDLPLSQPDIMNDTAFQLSPPTRRNTLSTDAGSIQTDTCRICRSEGTQDEPLFYPCKCSGSIKFVHQECLMEWLSHSHKKHCELCKTPFRFTKLYDANMPQTLPWGVFARRACWHVVLMLVRGLRTALVGCVWLGVVPWLIRWVWRCFFWIADAAWAREAYMQMMLPSSASTSTPPSNSERMANAIHQYFPSMNRDLKNIVFRQNASAGATTNTTNSFTWPQADPSILSPWTSLASLTPSARVNRLILDVFEGQLITCVVITGFILVFLIREWVVQQQPLVNLDNLQRDLREATERMQADNERLRRQTELLEQARARLAELQQETEDYLAAGAAGGEGRAHVQFMGWEALETLIDNATKHLRTSGGTEHAQFVSNALAVLMQIRMAANTGVGLAGVDGVEGLSEKVSQKLASLSTEEREEWEAVLVSAIKQAQQNQPSPGSLTESRLAFEEEPTARDVEWASQLAKIAHVSRNADEENAWEEIDELETQSAQIDAEATPAETSESPARRPPMPDRDISSRATQIQRIIADAEDVLANRNDNNSASASASASASHEHVEGSSDIHNGVYSGANPNAGNAGRLGISSVRSPDKTGTLPAPGATIWDHRKAPLIPIINAGPDAKINIRWSGTSRAPSALMIQEKMLDVDEKLLELKDEVAKETEQDSEVPTSADNNPFHPDGPDPEPRDNDSLGKRVASVFREEFGFEDAADADEPHQTEPDAELENPNTAPEPQDPPPQHTARHEPTYWERLVEWFWGDIQTPAAAEPVPVAEEERIPVDGANTAQVAPFTPTQDSQLAPESTVTAPEPAHQDPEPVHQNDPEVVAAAQQAGIDPEAIEDAEDLEGIFELIGLQGPLIGLFQTSAFCLLLVACTILGAVVLPYLGGKVVLSLAGSPVYFLIQMPLRAASFVVDAAIDVILLVAGAAVVTIAFAADFVLSAVQTWAPSIEGILLPEKVIAYCSNTMVNSASRLENLFPTADSADSWAWGWAFLRWSVHAHSSLRTIQDEVNAVLQSAGAAITWAVETVASESVLVVCKDTLTRMMDVPAVSASLHACRQWCQDSARPLFDIFAGAMRGTLTFSTSAEPLDPSLVYWNSTDRALAILTGYSALAALAAIYVAADTPITKSESGRKTEKMIRDTLRQAGGVLKVILIISIEMLVFPLYCGLLLDVAFLPLFKNADVASRWSFALRKPSTFCFVHWFVGTCYMFHFALFVGMCRKILRKGVLWFIRDPDDPTFHPVRDVLERNVTTQLRKIAFSALVYGALVICCLGGVIWSIGHVFDEIFPITWFTTEPILEFPMDMLLYNFLTPIIIRLFKPSDAVNSMYAWWLRRCARALRLSHFLFDDRRKDEEGRFVHKSWRSFFLMKRPNYSENLLVEDESCDIRFKKDGMYVLTPSNDQYRPPKPEEAFFVLDDDDACIVDKDGKKNDHFAKIYIPPLFRIRISLFMVCLWLFSAFAGLCSTLVPLVLGRHLLARFLPDGLRVSDIYAYSLGAYILGGGVMLAVNGRAAAIYVKQKAAILDVMAWFEPVHRFAIKALKCVYVYGFLGIMLPTIFALFLQLYVVLPLHTWSTSAALSTAQNTTELWSTNNTSPTTANLTEPTADARLGSLAGHSFHILQDYTLGLLWVRVFSRMIVAAPASRAVEVFHRVTANGYLNPDVRLATRFFVLPATIVATLVLLLPPLMAKSALLALRIFATDVVLDDGVQMKVYRYSYPFAASIVAALLGAAELSKATSRWRNRIRDEMYLVGERLHNFGDRRPPPGSKSVVRKER